jgi:DNA-binding beta-propeller fold protein YncE
MFGSRCRGKLGGPVDIAIDTSDMVYVSEWDDYRVTVYTSEGPFVATFGREGKGPGELDYPRGLAVDDNGVVYVCDRGNNRIQVY